MKFSALSSLLWTCFAVNIAKELDYTLDLHQHLDAFANYRHPLQNARDTAREYIQQKFQEYGLKVANQEFITEIASYDNDIIEVNGVNVIGESVTVSPNVQSPVILIGANYDSSLQRNPLMENGAAMASLLEIANVFQTQKQNPKFIQNIDVLFVAFDINCKAYAPSGKGKAGSQHFVDSYLKEYLSDRQFLGAIILDSISNFNQNNKTQFYFEGFEEAFPDIYSQINSAGAKGDFLALITRDDQQNIYMAQQFIHSYSSAGKSDPFRFQDLIVRDGMKVTPAFASQMDKYSHASFWKANPSLPAFLLTDMDITRVPADGDTCRGVCDADSFFTDSRKKFIERTTKAVIHMLIDEQANEADQPNEPAEVPSIEPTKVPSTEHTKVPPTEPTQSSPTEPASTGSNGVSLDNSKFSLVNWSFIVWLTIIFIIPH